jgi:hypothetical protein
VCASADLVADRKPNHIHQSPSPHRSTHSTLVSLSVQHTPLIPAPTPSPLLTRFSLFIVAPLVLSVVIASPILAHRHANWLSRVRVGQNVIVVQFHSDTSVGITYVGHIETTCCRTIVFYRFASRTLSFTVGMLTNCFITGVFRVFQCDCDSCPRATMNC